MSGPILYSANPWYATEIATKYRGGVHFAWVCECFDSSSSPGGSATALIAPTSNPRRIYRNLSEECKSQEEHSPQIKNYKKTFTRLARTWFSDGSITESQRDEIIASCKAPSWRIWEPVLYVIPKEPIMATGRLSSVPRSDRAGYGPEMQIQALNQGEFDIIRLEL